MKYGIIGAMDLETKLLIEAMKNVVKHEVAGMSFYEGHLCHADAVVVTSGVGKVNASACAQILVTKFDVEALINTGVSGALHHELEVGDVVISTDCMEHDVDVTVFGYKYGVIPRLETSIFVADDTLVEKAYSAGLEEIKDHKVLKGRIVSGDQFVSSTEKKAFLLENFDAYTTEMEGAAIAHVAMINQIPFVIIRAMSDKADGSAHVSFDEFAVEAAHHSSNMVINMLK